MARNHGIDSYITALENKTGSMTGAFTAILNIFKQFKSNTAGAGALVRADSLYTAPSGGQNILLSYTNVTLSAPMTDYRLIMFQFFYVENGVTYSCLLYTSQSPRD